MSLERMSPEEEREFLEARELALKELTLSGIIDEEFANKTRAEDQARLHPSTSVSPRPLVGKIRGIMSDIQALGQLRPESQAAQIEWESQIRHLGNRDLLNELIVNERLSRVNNFLDNAQQVACLGGGFLGGTILSYLGSSLLGSAFFLAGIGLLTFTSQARGRPYRILNSQISFLTKELRSRQQATPLIPPPSNLGIVSF